MTSTSSGLTMLTTGVSQYLHPDYYSDVTLPTTLDAKKSPLALLAQTCSAIGKDTSPSKSIIPPLEKKDNNNDKSMDKLMGESDAAKRPSSRGNNKDSSRDSKPGFRTFPPKEIPPLVPISSDKPLSLSVTEPKSSSPSGPVGASVPSSVSPSTRPVSAGGHVPSQRSSSRNSTGRGEGASDLHHHSQHRDSHSQHRSRDSPASSRSSPPSHRSAPSPSYSKPSHHSSPHMMQSLSSQSTSLSLTPTSSSSSVISHPSLQGGIPTSAHLGYPSPYALMGHGLDPSSSAYHSALVAAHSNLSSLSAAAAAAQSSALKAAAAAASAPSAVSPFVTYARVRTPSGATTLVPVCRDPFCNNCQLTVQNSHLSATCQAPGCAQCAHEKSLISLSTLGLAGAPSPSHFSPFSQSAASLSSSMSALSSLHSLYPHSALAAAQAAHQQGLPHVCTWIAGNDYCGKRFTSSEELLQHLRTHTPSMDASSLAASYASLGIPSSLAAAYPHLGTQAPLSPNSLRRNYPTSLSPVSSLLSASRYHPYKSPLSGVGATPPTPQSYPAPIGHYYSPYTLYGQRLAGAVVP